MPKISDKALQTVARQFADAFEGAERPDGGTYRRLRDTAPAWAEGVVFSAHGGMLPDDWRYMCIESAADAIADAGDLDEIAHEFADGFVDVYTSARLDWLASHAQRPAYCDDAQAEGLVDAEAGIVDRIGAGQYVEALEVFGQVLDALREVCESDDA